jgi:RNA polymerase sigma-70 factor (ECF subfamily)
MDTDLVIRAQQGDRAAFADIVAAMGSRLQSTADAILRDRTLAEDATQQALIGIWRDLPALRDPMRFEPWAFRVLVRICYAEGKRARRWMAGISGSVTTAVSDDVDAVIDRDQLERAFRRLTLEQRAVIVLHHYLDMSRTDVAAALGIPLGTVNSRLRHALLALRAAMEADARSPGKVQALEKVAP